MPKEERGQKFRLPLHLSQINYLFHADCPPLVGAVFEKNRSFLAFFRKSVSFNCNIEDLSALDDPRQTQQMFSTKWFVLQQTTPEMSSVTRALIHVAPLPREWIAVLSSRTPRESDKQRRRRTHYLGCCRCAAAAVLLLCC